MPVNFAHGQIVGPRSEQEDTIYAAQLADSGSWLFIMADGMGGHEDGALASRTAVETLTGCLENAMDVFASYEHANRDVVQLRRPGAEQPPGTTATTLIFEISKEAGNRFHMACGMMTLAHAGDSRCYRLRRSYLSPKEGQFSQLTRDHSWGRFIARVIGADKYIPPDMIFDSVEYDDRYLLCSDGLSDVLNDDEIADILRTAETPETAVQDLLALNKKEPRDNTSVIVIDVKHPSDTSAAKQAELPQRPTATRFKKAAAPTPTTATSAQVGEDWF